MKGRGSIYLRGKIWWIKYYRAGAYFRESSGSTDQRDALALLKLRQGDIARGIKVDPRQFRITVDELLKGLVNNYKANSLKSLDKIEIYIDKHLLPRFSGWRAANVSTADIEEYIVERQEAGAKNATINRELAALKRSYELAFQAGRIQSKPHIPMLRENNVRQGYFEKHQFDSVLKHLPEYLRPPVTMAYLTGWRSGEILSRQWHHVDWQGGTIRLEPGETKNGKPRIFPFHVDAELENVLRTQLERAKKTCAIVPWVFFHEDGSPIKSYSKAWKRARTLAGCPGRLMHDFRRTAVRNLERAGVARSVAMQLTGHLTESTYRRYGIVNEGDLANGVRKLQELKRKAE